MTTSSVTPRVLISAGEVSGDIVGAALITALRKAEPASEIDAVGGPRMAKAGARLITSANHLGAVGVSEGLAMVPSALCVLRQVKRHVRVARPDVAVLIANDIFNHVLARWLRRQGIATVALFPPQAWVWRPLLRRFARPLDLVLASFRHEEQCYREAGAKTVFVGHYLADMLSPVSAADRAAARQALGLPSAGPVVAILPGSRAHEVARLLPVLLGAIDVLHRRLPGMHAVAALTPAAKSAGSPMLGTAGGGSVLTTTDSHAAMRAADVVLCCSGTATLEAALLGAPHVVVYRMSRTTFCVVRLCIRLGLLSSDTIGLPNLVTGRAIVPELKQGHATAEMVAAVAATLITDGEPRQAMCAALSEVRREVTRSDTLTRAATLVLEHGRAHRPAGEAHRMIPADSRSGRA